MTAPETTDPGTRRRVLDLLKLQGPLDAATLAGEIGVSAMAVRQHLYALQDERLVTYHAVKSGVGRPAKHWRLTPAADAYFADRHPELAVGLLGALRTAFGAAGMEKLLAARTAQQIEAYRNALPRRGSLGQRLAALARLRTQEGYMAEVVRDAPGSYLLVERHCPICIAARACVGLCASEQAVFEALLDDASVERTEYILEGAMRCAYRVTSRKHDGRRSRDARPTAPV